LDINARWSSVCSVSSEIYTFEIFENAEFGNGGGVGETGETSRKSSGWLKKKGGGHSVAPKTTSANTASASP